jgi:hypothetical protein
MCIRNPETRHDMQSSRAQGLLQTGLLACVHRHQRVECADRSVKDLTHEALAQTLSRRTARSQSQQSTCEKALA